MYHPYETPEHNRKETDKEEAQQFQPQPQSSSYEVI